MVQNIYYQPRPNFRTKAIYMSEVIVKVAGEFSKEKKIALKEVMEGALVEYLMKYGFEREVEVLLKNT